MAEVDISSNNIILIGLNQDMKSNNWDPVGTEEHTVWDAMCETLPKSEVKVFKAANGQLNQMIMTLASSLSVAAVMEMVDLSNNFFTPSLLDGIKLKFKLLKPERMPSIITCNQHMNIIMRIMAMSLFIAQ